MVRDASAIDAGVALRSVVAQRCGLGACLLAVMLAVEGGAQAGETGTVSPNPSVDGPAPRQAPDRRFLVLPFIGVHAYSDQLDAEFGPGLRTGTVLGVRYNRRFSINGRIAMDVYRFKSTPPGADAGRNAFQHLLAPAGNVPVLQAALAPLAHFRPADKLEIVAGVTAGLFVGSGTGLVTDSGYTFLSRTDVTGWSLGANGAALFRASAHFAVGPLVAYDYEKGTSCSVHPSAETCTTTGLPARSVWSLSVGAMF
jgi:hypothetical protein